MLDRIDKKILKALQKDGRRCSSEQINRLRQLAQQPLALRLASRVPHAATGLAVGAGIGATNIVFDSMRALGRENCRQDCDRTYLRG